MPIATYGVPAQAALYATYFRTVHLVALDIFCFEWAEIIMQSIFKLTYCTSTLKSQLNGVQISLDVSYTVLYCLLKAIGALFCFCLLVQVL